MKIVLLAYMTLYHEANVAACMIDQTFEIWKNL